MHYWLVVRGLINGKCFRRPFWSPNCYIKFVDDKLQVIGDIKVSCKEVIIKSQPDTRQELITGLENILLYNDFWASDWEECDVPS